MQTVLGSGLRAKQGQILASIDDNKAKAEVLRNLALLAIAKSDLKSALLVKACCVHFADIVPLALLSICLEALLPEPIQLRLF